LRAAHTELIQTALRPAYRVSAVADTDLAAVIACQDRLIAALDQRDPSAIESASARLTAAIAQVRSRGAWHARGDDHAQIGHALKQCDAAAMRVNYLKDWTRQRIDSLAAVRGWEGPQLYSKP
jgi:hypothetical protein